MYKTIIDTTIPELKFFKRGKVRDMYDLGKELLIVSTDRISAFDCVLSEGVPLKGVVLNELSAFWFDRTKHIVSNHMVSIDPEVFPCQLSSHSREQLEKRSMLAKKTKPIAVECVVRGYLSGSAYKEYTETGKVAGVKLCSGLRESDCLPNPLFTPATKSSEGHDTNITFGQMQDTLGEEISQTLKEVSLRVYRYASSYLDSRGFILADTKFEFGFLNGNIVLIDEVVTPDSSRLWPKETYAPGVHQESFDKQFVRDYLEKVIWNKLPPPPPLPAEIVRKTSKIYREACYRITGKAIPDS